MCDKKNSVLFNDTECIVLSPNFKLIDESQVLLRVPGKNNMYNVDLKNIVPKGGLTCLFAKAIFDESKLWHRMLVAERRNKTLIEAAKTMLADSKLLTTFWAEAVNTAYRLCKFDGKADEGFFVGYSLNNKAFRVLNSRTRIVEENLHIRFSENTPNAVGTKTSDNADPKSSQDDESKPSSSDGKKVDEDPREDCECNDQEKEDNVNNTNNVNAVNAVSTNKVNAIGAKTSIELSFDPDILALEDISIFDFLRGDEDDMNNLDTTIQVSP
ncbi:ribonuclease H-like domain-containing protein, partial [Tanacetum coccineum]